jgi:hypothetical protein
MKEMQKNSTHGVAGRMKRKQAKVSRRRGERRPQAKLLEEYAG